jgi:hypothetical protein
VVFKDSLYDRRTRCVKAQVDVTEPDFSVRHATSP